LQRAEGRGQRAEGRGQRAEGRGQRAEGREKYRGARSFISLKNCEPIADSRKQVKATGAIIITIFST
jgi:hypothetical protein